jgi:hypothetical protein
MGWLNQIGQMLEQYAGGQSAGNAEQDFDQAARHAPPAALAPGLAEAFRSDQTPPFAQMVSQLFSQSDGGQRAGLLNTLLGAAGPGVLSQVLGGVGGGQGQITPHQANQIPPHLIEQAAAQAEQQNPSIVDRVSGFYAQHPGVVKALGGAALAAVLGGMARRQRDVQPASQDPYGDPADQQVLPSSQDPYGDPADIQVLPASRDPYGDPADQAGQEEVAPASQDPYGDPADDPRQR